MKTLLAGILALSMGSLAQAYVRDLDEAMTKLEKSATYQVSRDAGHKALDAKEFDTASKEFKPAGNATAFAWVRARMYANAAFALARAGRCTESVGLYKEALKVQKLAEAKASGGPKWAKARAKTRADIKWGLFESACKKAK